MRSKWDPSPFTANEVFRTEAVLSVPTRGGHTQRMWSRRGHHSWGTGTNSGEGGRSGV